MTQTEYALTITQATGGTIAADPAGPYYLDDEVTLTATADPGYSFGAWTGACLGQGNSCTLTMDGPKSVSASFTQDAYTLDVVSAHGPVTKDPDQLTYAYGTEVELTMGTVDPGWTFTGWSEPGCTDTGPCTVTMTADKTVTASFTQDAYTLDVSVVGNGLVTKDPDPATYLPGTSVQLTATADPGWIFTGWSGDLTGSTNPATITMNTNKAIVATFTQDAYTLDVTVVGMGSVTKDPDRTSYLPGTSVQLTATADPGWTFTGWSGDLSGIDNPANILMNGDRTVTATFSQEPYSLTVTTVGSGSVSRDKYEPYYYRDVVQLTATADLGWTFTGWSGDLSGLDNPALITITGNMNVTATFTQNEYTLETVVAGLGTVDRSSNGPYHYGDVVQLTAVPATGWHLVEWTGDLSGSTNPASITIDGNKSVTASFAINTYTLTYTAGSNGTLTGESTQTVNHGADGTPVTAVPNTGYHFVDWSDGSTANPRTDSNVTANVSAMANFAQTEYSLTITQATGGAITCQSGWSIPPE